MACWACGLDRYAEPERLANNLAHLVSTLPTDSVELPGLRVAIALLTDSVEVQVAEVPPAADETSAIAPLDEQHG